MTAELDLSFANVASLAAVVTGYLVHKGFPVPLAVASGLGVGLVGGLLNGFLVTRLKIPSFLVTLGMLLVVRGTALFITSGFPQRTWTSEGQWLAAVLVEDDHLAVGPQQVAGVGIGVEETVVEDLEEEGFQELARRRAAGLSRRRLGHGHALNLLHHQQAGGGVLGIEVRYVDPIQ